MAHREVISPSGAVTVACASALATELRAAFDRAGEEVELSLEAVSELDLAGVELLYGAFREAEQRGKSFGLSGRMQPAVARALQNGGFCPDEPEDAEQLPQKLLEPYGTEREAAHAQ
jgi:anti-anti-sigma regulatory factor